MSAAGDKVGGMLLTLLLACSEAPAPPVEAPPARPPQPDLVLVIIDTLRADHVGAYGYARPTTPNLDALAAEGVLFERAYAHSGWTLPSVASLLTGLLPHEHRVVRDGADATRFGALGPEVKTLGERLQGVGYATAAVVNNTFLAPEFGLNRGFDLYDWRGASQTTLRSAHDTAAAALAWLNRQDQPIFLLVHVMEPHAPYDPPPEVRGTFAPTDHRPVPVPFLYEDGRAPSIADLSVDGASGRRDYVSALYDEEILAADRALGELVAGLKARPRWGQTTLVVTADHGEELWDHGGFEHGHSLFGELTRVPLIAVGAVGPHRRVSTLVQHLDLHQSLLNLGGARPDPQTQGTDLWALPAGDAGAPTRVALSESCLYGPDRASVVNQRTRLVVDLMAGYGEVWAVDNQGGERERLQGEAQTEAGARLLPSLDRIRGDRAPIVAREGPQVADSEAFEQLTSLGYLDAR